MSDLKIILTGIDKGMPEAWQKYCGDLPGVEVYAGSIFETACDALVSPANSFGFMDGGLDLFISEFFGWHVQQRLQEIIRTKYHRELLVGQAEIVPTDHPKIPYVIAAPTMRVPLVLEKETVNSYLACRAVLLLIQHGTFPDGTPIAEKVRTVSFPGMGTGVGKVPFPKCAFQMRVAYEEVIQGNPPFPKTIWDETRRHMHISAQGK